MAPPHAVKWLVTEAVNYLAYGFSVGCCIRARFGVHLPSRFFSTCSWFLVVRGEALKFLGGTGM